MLDPSIGRTQSSRNSPVGPLAILNERRWAMAWQHQWRKHPSVRTGDQLSLGERAADKMRNGMGSWPFVFVFFGVMITWAIVNGLLHIGGGAGFDPYPFILLNLFL